MKYLVIAAVAAVGLSAGLTTAALAYSGEQFTTCNLDPNGDNWLALKAAPDIGSKRIARLGPDTPLLTWEPYAVGNWRQVTVLARRGLPYEFTDLSGWVHTGYICVDNW